jgi:hypothetical protein
LGCPYPLQCPASLPAMRGFVGIDLGLEAALAETTLCKFRRLLERNKLGKMLLKAGGKRCAKVLPNTQVHR